MIQETSHASHRQIRRCAPEMRQRILGALRASPAPLTDEEIQEKTGLNPSSERPRRIELVEAGEIVPAPMTKTTKSGRKALAWMPAGFA
jgi:DNA-binding IclR family transcriptional regulator